MFRELDVALNFINNFITSNDLANLYSQLATAYGESLQSSTEENTQKISELREKISQTHSAVDLESWPEGKVDILDRLEALDLIGIHALELISEIYQLHQGNTPAIINALNDLSTKTQQLKQRVENIMKDFKVPTEAELKAPNGKEIFEISFEGDAELSNFNHLKEQGDEWWLVVYTFAWLTGTPIDDVKFISAGKGSFFLGCEANINFVNAIITSINLILGLRLVYLEIWQVKKRIKELNLTNQEGIKVDLEGIEIKYDEWLSAKINGISIKIMDDSLTSKINDKGVQNTLGGFLEKALKVLYLFTVKGGKVTQPSEKKINLDGKELTLGQVYTEIRKLREDVQPLLEENNQSKIEESIHKQVLITAKDEKELVAEGAKTTEETTDGHKKKAQKTSEPSDIAEKEIKEIKEEVIAEEIKENDDEKQ